MHILNENILSWDMELENQSPEERRFISPGFKKMEEAYDFEV